MQEVRNVGKVQAGSCFIEGENKKPSDFFTGSLRSNGGGKRQLWRIASGGKVERLMLGDASFLVPLNMLNQVPNGYLFQETVIQLRLKLSKGDDLIILFPSIDGYGLLQNDKVLTRIEADFKRKIKLFGMFVDDKQKILYLVKEVFLTLNELVRNWDIWVDIFKGYFPLVILGEKSRETGWVMTITERCISPKETLGDKHLSDLANFIVDIIYGK